MKIKNNCELLQHKINELMNYIKEIYYNYYYCNKCGKSK